MRSLEIKVLFLNALRIMQTGLIQPTEEIGGHLGRQNFVGNVGEQEYSFFFQNSSRCSRSHSKLIYALVTQTQRLLIFSSNPLYVSVILTISRYEIRDI